MPAKKIELSRITLKTDDGQEVHLTIEQAKALHGQLDELFGTKTQYVPSTPIIIERDRWPTRPYWLDVTSTGGRPGELMCIAQLQGMQVSYLGTQI